MSNKDTFNRWTLKDPRRISALFAGKGRRGIYVLEYADGSMYVGQATDVVGRYNSHYHGSGHHEAWEDVVALRFAEVPAGQDLNEPERAEIHRL
ncbi:GIY-YIG nuclease family protein [Corynebacterium sp. 32222D000AT]